MTLREADWTRTVCDNLKEQGAMVIALVASSKQQNGLPDRILIHKKLGKPIFLEFKGEHTPLQTNQKRIMAQMNKTVAKTAFIIKYPGMIEYSAMLENNKSVVYNIGFFEDGELLNKLVELLNMSN